MLGFLYKDIRTNLKWLIIGILVILFMVCLMTLAMVAGDEKVGANGLGSFMKIMLFALEGSAFIITGAFTLNYIQSDERRKWGYFVTSVSGGRAKQVAAKYVFVALNLGLTFLICEVNNLIVRHFVEDAPDLTELLISMVCLSLIMRALELPCIFAFGTKAGTQIKGGMIVLILLGTAVYFLFGDLSWMGTEDEIWEKIFVWIQGFDISKLMETAVGKILLAGPPMYIVSCFISAKLYLKGVDRMEK
ncbi:MAG: ABC-2 transporter permease [Ruminococcus sp.]|nr:ABC-2 transporter permease [Ruminococcus sp.]